LKRLYETASCITADLPPEVVRSDWHSQSISANAADCPGCSVIHCCYRSHCACILPKWIVNKVIVMDAIWFQQTLERAGVSQADLARHLRLAPSAVSRMVKGERQMKLLEAVQIAAFLGVSQDEVLRHAGAESE